MKTLSKSQLDTLLLNNQFGELTLYSAYKQVLDAIELVKNTKNDDYRLITFKFHMNEVKAHYIKSFKKVKKTNPNFANDFDLCDIVKN